MFNPWRGDVPQHVTKVYLYSVAIIKENDIFHVIFTSFIVSRSCFDLWHILLQHLIIKFKYIVFILELNFFPDRREIDIKTLTIIILNGKIGLSMYILSAIYLK